MPEGWTTTDAGAEPVEFLIGMRWLELWRLAARPWVPLAFARMLVPQPAAGLRSTRFSIRRGGPVVVQRWASRAAGDGWARDHAHAHAAPWGRFAREEGRTASWGIWHEVAAAGS